MRRLIKFENHYLWVMRSTSWIFVRWGVIGRRLLLGIGLMIAVCQGAVAEPNSEETIAYINSWLQKNVLGKEWTEGLKYDFVNFTGGLLRHSARDSKGHARSWECSGINWALAQKVSTGNGGAFRFVNQGQVTYFASPHIRCVSRGLGGDEDKMDSGLIWHSESVDQEEIEKLERAVAHLVKLSKSAGSNIFFEGDR